jgi:hypothetical protein
MRLFKKLHRAATVNSLQHMSVGFHRTNLLAIGRFSTVFQLRVRSSFTWQYIIQI